MPRYVILAHDHPFPHWDFLLERDGVLQSWRLSRLPRPDSSDAIPAEELPDHRLAYLEYEGPVSGNRGHVVRVDQGDYEVTARQEEGLEIMLRGEQFRGRAVCRHDEERVVWTFHPESDAA